MRRYEAPYERWGRDRTEPNEAQPPGGWFGASGHGGRGLTSGLTCWLVSRVVSSLAKRAFANVPGPPSTRTHSISAAAAETCT